MQKTDCDECRETYAAYDEDPPCGRFGRPDYSECTWLKTQLDPDNETLWEIYRRVIGQHVSGFYGNGPLNILAVYETMDRLGIPRKEQLDLLDEIMALDRKVMEAIKTK